MADVFSYGIGARPLIVVGSVAVLVDLPVDDERIQRIFAALTRDESVDSVLEALVSQGMSNLPGFGIIATRGEQARVALRGDIRAVVDGEDVVGKGFFTDVTVTNAVVRMLYGQAPMPAVFLPVGQGVVAAGAVSWNAGRPAVPAAGVFPDQRDGDGHATSVSVADVPALTSEPPPNLTGAPDLAGAPDPQSTPDPMTPAPMTTVPESTPTESTPTSASLMTQTPPPPSGAEPTDAEVAAPFEKLFSMFNEPAAPPADSQMPSGPTNAQPGPPQAPPPPVQTPPGGGHSGGAYTGETQAASSIAVNGALLDDVFPESESLLARPPRETPSPEPGIPAPSATPGFIASFDWKAPSRPSDPPAGLPSLGEAPVDPVYRRNPNGPGGPIGNPRGTSGGPYPTGSRAGQAPFPSDLDPIPAPAAQATLGVVPPVPQPSQGPVPPEPYSQGHTPVPPSPYPGAQGQVPPTAQFGTQVPAATLTYSTQQGFVTQPGAVTQQGPVTAAPQATLPPRMDEPAEPKPRRSLPPEPDFGQSGPIPPKPEASYSYPPAEVEATIRKSQLSSYDGGTMVIAVTCPVGHANPPYAAQCRVCGLAVPPQQPHEIPRPPLGVIHLSSGGAVLLDRGVILGRNPRPIPCPDGLQPNLIKIADPNRDISSQHLQVRLDDWFVAVVDLNSTNGTQVILPNRPPVTLRPDEPMTIDSGSRVILANAFDFVFEAA